MNSDLAFVNAAILTYRVGYLSAYHGFEIPSGLSGDVLYYRLKYDIDVEDLPLADPFGPDSQPPRLESGDGERYVVLTALAVGAGRGGSFDRARNLPPGYDVSMILESVPFLSDAERNYILEQLPS